MIEEFLEIKETESWDELCTRMGSVLGLEGPVPSSVLKRVMDDPLYAHHLITCRNTPGFLNVLLNDPRNKVYEVPETVEEKTNIELISGVSRALLRWGKAGFSKVDEETYQERLATCRQCSHFVDPPRKLLYKVMMIKKPSEKICKLCGCFISRKAKLSTESCPDSRW